MGDPVSRVMRLKEAIANLREAESKLAFVEKYADDDLTEALLVGNARQHVAASILALEVV